MSCSVCLIIRLLVSCLLMPSVLVYLASARCSNHFSSARYGLDHAMGRQSRNLPVKKHPTLSICYLCTMLMFCVWWRNVILHSSTWHSMCRDRHTTPLPRQDKLRTVVNYTPVLMGWLVSCRHVHRSKNVDRSICVGRSIHVGRWICIDWSIRVDWTTWIDRSTKTDRFQNRQLDKYRWAKISIARCIDRLILRLACMHRWINL
jgi:hypothetical protein